MRLLMVEDDTELSSSLHSRLKREGFAVDIASNGVDGSSRSKAALLRLAIG